MLSRAGTPLRRLGLVDTDDRPPDTLHRSMLLLDIEGYSRPPSTNSMRGHLRKRLYRLLDDAIGSVGIGLGEPPADQGDGALVLFPPEVPKSRLLNPLMSTLASGLAESNRDSRDRERLRMRAVIHAGELLSDDHGYFGEDLDLAFGLINADQLRACLARTPSPLVLLVTDPIYQGVVKHDLPGIDPASYTPLAVRAKRGTVDAWLHIPTRQARPGRTLDPHGTPAPGRAIRPA